MSPAGPDEPTRIYEPVGPSRPPFDSGPPTQALPPTEAFPPDGPPPPFVPGTGGPGGGSDGEGPNRWIIGLLAVIVALAVVIIVLLLTRNSKSHNNATSPTSTTTSSTTTSSTSTTSTVPATLPPLPTSTSTSTPQPGNRAATPAEQQQILHDVSNPPNSKVDLFRIANTDPTWALIHVTPTAGHEQEFQAAYKILHLDGGTWTQVSSGTAQVSCNPNIPPNIVADFSNILGTCGSGA
jgi:hypothetical protein